MFFILTNSITFLFVASWVDTAEYSECLDWQENVTSKLVNYNIINKDDFKYNSDALYLTPSIEDNRLEEALAASEVKSLPGIGTRLKSYSGFLTVNKKFNSNLFFWFFPPLSKDAYAPVLLWLSGGPGDASVKAMFTQNRPLQVDANGKPSLRNFTWNREFALLYIDNPAGTGFSFTDSEEGYARNADEAAKDLYEGLRQFFTIFANYRHNAFYLTGYSYACKFNVALASRIREMNNKQSINIKMNLQGVAIGGGYCDQRHNYDIADFVYQFGLIQEADWTYYWLRQLEYLRLISDEKWVQANDLINDLYNGYYFGCRKGSDFHTGAGYVSLKNLLAIEDPPEISYFPQYLLRRATRNAIHVGSRTYNSPALPVIRAMFQDIAHSVEPQMEALLNAQVRMLFYNGNLDLVTPLAAMKNVMRNLQWNGTQKYLDAQTQIYRVNSEGEDGNTKSIVAGYVRQADNLQFVILRNAGHLAALDQPQVTLDVITRFVKGIQFNAALSKI